MTTDRSLAVKFGWVSLFQDLGSKMVIPILPLYLVASVGATPFIVGLIDGIGAATAALAAPIAGRLAMRRRPRPLVQLGYGLSSIAKLALALPGGWGYVLGVRVVDRLGKGVRDAPRDVILASGSKAKHGRTFGIQQAMDKTGGFLGPLIGLGIYHLAGQRFAAIFIAAFIPCAISVWLLRSVPDVDPASDSTNPEPAPSTTPLQRQAVGAMGLHALAFVPTSLLLLRGAAIGMSVTALVVAYSGLRFVTALASYPSGTLVDRFGAGRVVITGAAGTTAAMLIGGLAQSSVTIWLALLLVGGSEALTKGPVKAWLVGLGPHEARGAVLGDRSSISSVAGLVSGMAAGALWGTSGQLPFVLAAAIAAAATMSITMVHRRTTQVATEAT